MWIVTLLILCTVLCCSQGHKQEADCLNQNTPLPMIKEMIKTSELIEKSLPTDNLRSHRILGKIAKKSCLKGLKLADIRHILDIYDEHVFQTLWRNSNAELPKRFTESFGTLRSNVETCENKVKRSLSDCVKVNLETIKNNLMKLHRKNLSKAQSEFTTVLIWISNFMNRGRKHETH